jgi:regulatory protein
MKKITSIKQKSNNKYELLIDNEKHIIYGDVLLDCGIFRPTEIDTTTYMKIINDNNYYMAYHKIVSYINYKKRTAKEVRDKLKTIVVNKRDIDKIIDKLYEKGLLNENNYLDSYINDQINLTLNGPFKIRYNLSKLGLNENDIESHLNIIEDTIWYARVKSIINKKLKTNQHSSRKGLIQKIRTELNNLGYPEKYYIDELNNLDISDQDNRQKDYIKYKNKLSKKYSGDKLELMVKKKLYSLGYEVNDI